MPSASMTRSRCSLGSVPLHRTSQTVGIAICQTAVRLSPAAARGPGLPGCDATARCPAGRHSFKVLCEKMFMG
ncbi:MAG: hypothetical protein LBQ54_16120 [Planctomycetaceae bacterium]|nr:hypothetical protein [Planctomycetaceae bacterium]